MIPARHIPITQSQSITTEIQHKDKKDYQSCSVKNELLNHINHKHNPKIMSHEIKLIKQKGNSLRDLNFLPGDFNSLKMRQTKNRN